MTRLPRALRRRRQRQLRGRAALPSPRQGVQPLRSQLRGQRGQSPQQGRQSQQSSACGYILTQLRMQSLDLV